MDDLIAAIRRRSQTTTTDLGGVSCSPLKPGSPIEFSDDEKRLGFALPSLLKRIYTEIGNGGFWIGMP